MVTITSAQNERIKYIVKLKNDKHLRVRDAVILVEGSYELKLAFKSGLQASEIYFCKELAGIKTIPGMNREPILVTRSVFEKISHREGPDGWLGVVKKPNRGIDPIQIKGIPFFILVEAVEKPGNLGAILRTADAVGVDGVILCDPRADLFGPNVIRASRGTVFTVPCVEMSSAEALTYLRTRAIPVLAATPKADLIYTEVDLCKPICIAVGTEDVGLSDVWMDEATIKVKIPMLGKVNSLNVATSSAIILYEARRQRDRTISPPTHT